MYNSGLSSTLFKLHMHDTMSTILLSFQMNDHIEENCPHTKVECTFAYVGCKVKVRQSIKTDCPFSLISYSTASHSFL